MRYNILIGVSFIVSILIAFIVFSLFGHCKTIEFYFYDSLSLVVGFVMIGFSSYLIKKESGHKYVHLMGIIVGATMIATHLVKLFIGQCI